MISIKEKDFESFFQAPLRIRGKNSLYASPFKPDLKKMLSLKNPMFNSEDDFTYFTAFKNSTPVGRITAHIHDAFNERYKVKKCYFGFFECINDQEVAHMLLQHVEVFASRHGCDSVSGNFNLTAMQEMGMMISGFDKEPYILQSYGMPYYPNLLKQEGFLATFPMSTYEIDLLKLDPKKVLHDKQLLLLNDSDYRFIPITKSMYPKLRETILEIFNKGFDKNPLFVPITLEEFDFQAKDLVYLMDSHISFLALHKEKPVGLSIHIPDINPVLRASGGKLNLTTFYHFIKSKFKKDRTLCVFSAILPAYQNKGVLGVILYHTLKAMKKNGYKKFGITWISEGNQGSLAKMRDADAAKLHELRIFDKSLHQ